MKSFFFRIEQVCDINIIWNSYIVDAKSNIVEIIYLCYNI